MSNRNFGLTKFHPHRQSVQKDAYTPAWYERQARWKHFGWAGSCSFIMSALRSIQNSKTTSEHAKYLTREVESLLFQLRQDLQANYIPLYPELQGAKEKEKKRKEKP